VTWSVLPRKLARVRRVLAQIATYVAATTSAAILVFPILWMVSGSLKTKDVLLTETVVRLIPAWPWQWHNYVDAWREMGFSLYLGNSLILAVASVVGGALTASMVAYSFARLRFRGRDVLFVVLLGTMMIPGEVTSIPTFLLFHRLGWLNTYLPLILPMWCGGGAVNVFLLRQYIMTIPQELDDAARIDGCSPIGIYRHVVIPNIGPALAAVAIFIFTGSWNNLWGPLIYLTDPRLWTVPVGLLQFKRGLESSWGGMQINLHWLLAMATIASVPSLVVFICFQRYMISGIVMTGIKA
jgi:multiple sugar transport system permease protein